MAGWNGSYREAWEANAAGWTAYARDPDLDFYFWSFNLPRFLEILPPPGSLTFDIGCGEGRVTRALERLGHRVVAFDSSLTLVRDAAQAGHGSTFLAGDAEHIPARDATVDLAVGFMVYMDVDDLNRCFQEVSRILRPGGRLCLAVIHPTHSWKWDPDASYFTTRYVTIEANDTPRPFTLHTSHRTVGDYFAALENAQLLIEQLREPVPPDEAVARFPKLAPFTDRPSFLHLRAVRVG